MSKKKNWTINHQNKYSSLYRYLEEDLNMDVRYDDYIETYKRQLMSIIEKAKKKIILIILMAIKKIGYLWLLDIYIYTVIIDIQNCIPKLDINI